jgi:cephalosporin hydroxylase
LSRQISTFPLAAGVTRNLSIIVASFREDDSMAEDVAARYVLAGGVDTVHGWLGGGAITATLVIHDWQVRNNVQGNVAEIGIHHGKYFLVLKNLCRPEEIAIAIDVFEDQHLNTDNSGRGDRQIFESNISAHSDGINIEIIQGDSKFLDPERIIAAGKDRRVRLFSVDGSHTMEHTFSDLVLAGSCLTEGGVLVLDDFYSQYWPGVQEGFHYFMSKMGDQFAPIAIGDNKLYICLRRDHDRLLHVFKNELQPFYFMHKNVVLWNTDVVSMSVKSPENIFSRDLKFERNVFFFSRDQISSRCILRSGWSFLEVEGTWTIGETAVVEMQLINPPRSGEVMLQLNLVPFLHDRRTSRKIDVFVNDVFVGSRQLGTARIERIGMPIDAGMLGPTTTVRIDVECPEQPSKFSLSPDARQLGVKVVSIKFVGNAG